MKLVLWVFAILGAIALAFPQGDVNPDAGGHAVRSAASAAGPKQDIDNVAESSPATTEVNTHTENANESSQEAPQLNTTEITLNTTEITEGLGLTGRVDHSMRIRILTEDKYAQHVGQFQGQMLWNEIHHCLWKLCWEDRGYNYCPRGGICYMEGVYYDDTKGGLGTRGGFLRLQLKSVSFDLGPANNRYGERTALFNAVAYAYKAMTDNNENCYLVPLSGQEHKFCQVARHVRFEWDSGKRGGWLETTLDFNFRTNPKNVFHCIRSYTSDPIKEHLRNVIDPALRESDPSLWFASYDVDCPAK